MLPPLVPRMIHQLSRTQSKRLGTTRNLRAPVRMHLGIPFCLATGALFLAVNMPDFLSKRGRQKVPCRLNFYPPESTEPSRWTRKTDRRSQRAHTTLHATAGGKVVAIDAEEQSCTFEFNPSLDLCRSVICSGRLCHSDARCGHVTLPYSPWLKTLPACPSYEVTTPL